MKQKPNSIQEICLMFIFHILLIISIMTNQCYFYNKRTAKRRQKHTNTKLARIKQRRKIKNENQKQKKRVNIFQNKGKRKYLSSYDYTTN